MIINSLGSDEQSHIIFSPLDISSYIPGFRTVYLILYAELTGAYKQLKNTTRKSAAPRVGTTAKASQCFRVCTHKTVDWSFTAFGV